MNKLTSAVVVGIGWACASLVSPVQADPIIQTINPTQLTVEQFDNLFQPVSNAPVMTSTYNLYGYSGAPETGVMQSQVFQGVPGTVAEGLYAYAYQIGVSPNVTASTGVPAHVDSASFVFNSTPVGTDFTNAGSKSYAYVVNNGQIGGLNLPQAAPGGVIQVPSTLSWEPSASTSTGVIRAQYVDPNLGTPALTSGANSATFVLISTQPFTTQPVNLGSSVPTTGGLTQVYSAEGGQIQPIPIPEPATLLSWAGVVGAIALVRQVRKQRAAA
jgi:hypothetical protein